MGTGGGLGQARESFGQGSCLVINGDVAFDLDLAAIVEAHQEAARTRGAALTMVLHHLPGLNQVLTQGERIIGFRDDRPDKVAGQTRRLAYTCVQVVEPQVFDYLPRRRPGGLITAYRRMIKEGHLLRAHILEGERLWSDIGRLTDYLDLHRKVLSQGVKALGRRFAGPVLLAPGARLEEGALVEGFACLGPEASVGAGARLTDALVMAGGSVAPGAWVERGVVGPGVRFQGRLKDGVSLG
jgi:NDP-sugar pyrophosphorylase family protein